MKIILSRHGETQETIAGILQGHLHGILAKSGIEQAKKLALKLKDENIDLIFCSNLNRSLNTAKFVQKFHINTPLISTALLRERSFGIYEGKNKNDIGFYDEDKKEIFDNPPNGESIEDICIRANTFLKDIFNKHFNKTILIISHDDIGKALVSTITGKDMNSIKSMPKASITIIDILKIGQYKIDQYGNTQHLI